MDNVKVILLLFSCLVGIGVQTVQSDANPFLESTSGKSATKAHNAYQDVPYGSDPRQVMDVYIPDNATAAVTKIILLIHGGGWSSGNKEDMNGFASYFSQAFPQHAIANMNYRLATIESPSWYKQLIDISMAISFLKSKAPEYSLNPRFALAGISAGGHLSLLYSYGYDSARDVDVVINIVGPTNVADPKVTEDPVLAPILLNLVGNYTFKQNPWLYYVNSPIFYVNSSSPKTMGFYGDSDPLIPKDQGEMLEDVLDSHGVSNKFYLYQGGGHFNFTTAQYGHMDKKIRYFLGSNFK